MVFKASYGSMALILIVWSSPCPAAAERWTQFTDFSRIHALADGGRQLWMATPGGLVRMDKATGARSYFNQANSALPDSRIHSLACDTAGRLAAISRTGFLVEFSDGAWTNHSASPPLLGQLAQDAGWTPEGGLWVLAADAVNRLPYLLFRRAGSWSRFDLEGAGTLAYGGYTYSYSPYYGTGTTGPYWPSQPYLQVDGLGRAWAMLRTSSRHQLFRVTPEGQADNPPVPDHLFPMLLVLGSSGTPYWLCSRSLATPAPDGSWDTLAYAADLHPPVRAHPRNILARAADGSEYWSLSRLMRLSAGAWIEATIPGETPSFDSPLLLEDACAEPAGPAPWPCLYAGRDSRLSFREAGSWISVDVARRPLSGNAFQSILPRGNGSDGILLDSYTGLQSLDPRTSITAPVDLGAAWGPGVKANALGVTPDGTVLLSIRNTLARLGPDGAETLIPPDTAWAGANAPYPGGAGYMATDKAGTVWVADGGRLLAMPRGGLDPRAWTSHRLPPPWNAGTVLQGLAAHPDGSVWVAAHTHYSNPPVAEAPIGFLARFDGTSWTFYDRTHHPWIGGQSTRDIRCDGDGNVWARYAGGLLQWDGAAWKEHPAAALAPFGRIRALAVAPDGRLWAATNLPDAMLLRWTGRWEPVAESRGVFAASQVESMAFDRSGRLWMLLTANGVLAFDPAGNIPTAVPVPARPAARAGTGRAVLVRRADGAWRQGPGPLRGEAWPGLRALDLLGRPAPGRAHGP